VLEGAVPVAPGMRRGGIFGDRRTRVQARELGLGARVLVLLEARVGMRVVVRVGVCMRQRARSFAAADVTGVGVIVPVVVRVETRGHQEASDERAERGNRQVRAAS